MDSWIIFFLCLVIFIIIVSLILVSNKSNSNTNFTENTIGDKIVQYNVGNGMVLDNFRDFVLESNYFPDVFLTQGLYNFSTNSFFSSGNNLLNEKLNYVGNDRLIDNYNEISYLDVFFGFSNKLYTISKVNIYKNDTNDYNIISALLTNKKTNEKVQLFYIYKYNYNVFKDYTTDETYSIYYNIIAFIKTLIDTQLHFKIIGGFYVANWGKIIEYVFGNEVYHTDNLQLPTVISPVLVGCNGLVVKKTMYDRIEVKVTPSKFQKKLALTMEYNLIKKSLDKGVFNKNSTESEQYLEDLINVPSDTNLIKPYISLFDNEKHTKMALTWTIVDYTTDTNVIRSIPIALNNNLDTIKTQLSTITGDLTTLKTNVSTINSDITTMKADIEALKNP